MLFYITAFVVNIIIYILDYHKRNDGMRGFVYGVLFFCDKGDNTSFYSFKDFRVSDFYKICKDKLTISLNRVNITHNLREEEL